MSITVLTVNGIALAALATALIRDRKRAAGALRTAGKMFVSILPMLIIIILLISLLFGFIPEESLTRFLGNQSGPLGTLVTAIVGSFLHIPAILAFPLAGSLLEKGASVTVVAAFITTLTMIGIVTLPLEIKEMGRRFALMRNGFSFAAALAIAFLMGVLF
ncbi:MAG: permease [Spirochaetaceae bacterium]|nr:permease [Spirochaetaceae bacterium]MDT8298071.1 permease [Spirochaetaceae bacterium]